MTNANSINLNGAITPWLANEGPENDIVVSSRIRLARNISGFPFFMKATAQDKKAIRGLVFQAAKELFPKDSYYFIDLDKAETTDRLYLLERQLVSRELTEAEGARSCLIDSKERFCVMVNEEDHLRIHGSISGFRPLEIWNTINETDDLLESKLPFVFHEKLGYLTACPTNVGTGLRVSVMLHLPGLVITKEIDKMFRALQKCGLTVRGLYGEGSQALGDFYQISNQTTLGRMEEELIQKVSDFIPQIIEYERRARTYLSEDKQAATQDRCARALGILKNARTIGSVETLHHLSNIRLGIHLGILDEPDIAVVNNLLINSQPAHLQKYLQKDSEQSEELSSQERDIERAKFLRKTLET
ncbi:MAG: protein arginine kinase [Planctomycetaceae bacterium]|nr:protein arginine kinase [Planctomycetaceae bacterium]